MFVRRTSKGLKDEDNNQREDVQGPYPCQAGNPEADELQSPLDSGMDVSQDEAGEDKKKGDSRGQIFVVIVLQGVEYDNGQGRQKTKCRERVERRFSRIPTWCKCSDPIH